VDIGILMSVLVDPKKRYFQGGGIERIVFTTFPYLAKKHNIEVFAPSTGRKSISFDYKGMRINLIGKKVRIPLHERAYFRAEFPKFDVVLYTDPPSAFMHPGVEGKKFTMVHNTVHGNEAAFREDFGEEVVNIVRSLEAVVLRKAIKISEKIISISPLSVSYLKKLGARDVEVTGVGIEFPDKVGKKEALALSIGRIYRYKGFFEVAEALADMDLDVIIAGKGPKGEELRKFVRSIENVHYLGYVSEQKKEELLRKALLFVFMSKSENFGIAPLEGAAYACYPVLRELPAFDYVFGRIDGIYVHSKEELRRKVEELLENQKETEKKAREIRRKLRKRWNVRRVAKEYERILEA